jgi:hypothetical protein
MHHLLHELLDAHRALIDSVVVVVVVVEVQVLLLIFLCGITPTCPRLRSNLCRCRRQSPRQGLDRPCTSHLLLRRHRRSKVEIRLDSLLVHPFSMIPPSCLCSYSPLIRAFWMASPPTSLPQLLSSFHANMASSQNTPSQYIPHHHPWRLNMELYSLPLHWRLSSNIERNAKNLRKTKRITNSLNQSVC